MTLDIKKFVAIMGMTGSDSDGEALNAVRMANIMLRTEGKTWSDVLRPPVLRAPVADYRTPPSKRGRRGDTSRYGRPASQSRPDDDRKVTDPEIATMLSALAERRHEVSTLMFLASIRDFWEREGFLTGPQFDAIKQMYEGVSGAGVGRGARWSF